MATSKKSLASRAGSAVRRAVRGRPAEAEGVTAGESGTEPAAKKAAAKKAAVKKAAVKKAPVKKAPAKKAAVKKTATKTATKTAATKTAAKKTAAKKTAAKKTAAKKTPATKKSAPATKAAAKKTSPATKATATSKSAPAKSGTSSAAGGRGAEALVVREGESPWTEAELDEVRAHLDGDVARLRGELEQADTGLHDLMVDSGDGSGPDPADLGSSSFERDHEISIANNARDMLEQSQHALERIEDGSYGVCERNGEPIGKLRLMAFPRATLCMPCKQREERR